jgi:hypothetical protein
MSKGMLYRSDNGQPGIGVDYVLHHESETNYWGELTLAEPGPVTDGAGYILELEDRRRTNCYLRKRVNRAVCGLPPRYSYHFIGSGALEPDTGRLITGTSKEVEDEKELAIGNRAGLGAGNSLLGRL